MGGVFAGRLAHQRCPCWNGIARACELTSIVCDRFDLTMLTNLNPARDGCWSHGHAGTQLAWQPGAGLQPRWRGRARSVPLARMLSANVTSVEVSALHEARSSRGVDSEPRPFELRGPAAVAGPSVGPELPVGPRGPARSCPCTPGGGPLARAVFNGDWPPPGELEPGALHSKLRSWGVAAGATGCPVVHFLEHLGGHSHQTSLGQKKQGLASKRGSALWSSRGSPYSAC